jgi:hypothetical protein
MSKQDEDWGARAAQTAASGTIAALEAAISGSAGSAGAVLALTSSTFCITDGKHWR